MSTRQTQLSAFLFIIAHFQDEERYTDVCVCAWRVLVCTVHLLRRRKLYSPLRQGLRRDILRSTQQHTRKATRSLALAVAGWGVAGDHHKACILKHAAQKMQHSFHSRPLLRCPQAKAEHQRCHVSIYIFVQRGPRSRGLTDDQRIQVIITRQHN